MKAAKRKLPVWFGIPLLLAVAASGCTGGNTGDGSKAVEKPQDKPKETAAKAPEAGSGAGGTDASKLPPVELTYYYQGAPQKDLKLVEEAMNKILKAKINTTIKLNQIDLGSFEQKMNVMTAAGDPYDLVFTSTWSNNYFQNVAKGAYLPLDELLDKYAPTLKKTVPAKMWDAARVNGKIYGALNYQIVAMPYGVNIRKDLAEKYHFDVDKTTKYEDLEPLLDQVVKNEKGIYPVKFYTKWDHFNVAAPYFGMDTIGEDSSPGWYYLNDPKIKVVNQYETPEYKQFSELMRKWYLKGYFRKDAASVTDVTAEIKAGKYAAQIAKPTGPGSDTVDILRFGFDGILKSYSKPLVTTSRTLATLTAISKTSKNPERAMMFLELINTDKELYNLIAHGIEGKHYVFTDKEKGVIGLPPGATPESIGYAPGTDWMYGNQFNSYYIDKRDVGNWEKTIKLNNEADTAPLLGFSFNPETVKTELAQTGSVIQQYHFALISGTIDPATGLPEFLDKLKKAGVDKIIAEKQKQVDEWVKTKK
ncbi:ABC transporter substrate-binding protein [Paenibacillus thalictri]|uniref:DUF3502 domain-containing protein n=1 Tax=Paenibacillus thalictri TaxID=2527873 RepID=A0A4Q9DW47_9BACL|nr:ABC transporter substrate-binding protein [Paenibacillus thalictri]TBL79938.1 DUF3502 domain-containing protein [Paenibacillus thalictri]